MLSLLDRWILMKAQVEENNLDVDMPKMNDTISNLEQLEHTTCLAERVINELIKERKGK